MCGAKENLLMESGHLRYSKSHHDTVEEEKIEGKQIDRNKIKMKV